MKKTILQSEWENKSEVTTSSENYEKITNENIKLKKLLLDMASVFATPYQDIDANNLSSSIKILLTDKFSPQKIMGKIGERIYQIHKSNLEKKHWGKFVVIDTDKEEVIAVEETPISAMIEAKRIKDKSYFLRQIGIKTIIH